MKLLLVEDEVRLAQALTQGFKERGDVVEWAADGLIGESLALNGTWDAMILDVMLPGRDGFQILEAVRKAGRVTPILMLTARTSIDDRVRGLDLGADDYLPKPFEFKELLARLRAVTRRPAVELRQSLTVGDLEMDLQTREVRRGGRLLDLTAKETGLLEYLMRRKGLVLTRGMILENVWASDYGYDGGSNIVEVYINFLRKKVDQGNPVKLIQTVRGAGYMIAEPAACEPA